MHCGNEHKVPRSKQVDVVVVAVEGKVAGISGVAASIVGTCGILMSRYKDHQTILIMWVGERSSSDGKHTEYSIPEGAVVVVVC